MPFEFRPEFHIDFKLEVVWPKLRRVFKGMAGSFRNLNPFKGIRLEAEGYAPLARRALGILACLALAAVAIVLVVKLLFR